MRAHTKIYIDFFGIVEQDFICCEYCCTAQAVDIHHIEPRGAGGSKAKDYIENLMSLCRSCHNRAEFVEQPILRKEELQDKHMENLMRFQDTGEMWF